MKAISRIAAAVLLAGGTAGVLTLTATPAAAQKKKDADAKLGGASAKDLSKPGRAAIVEAQKLEAAGDLPGALAALKAAEATGGLNATDSWFTGQTKLGLTLKLNDNAELEKTLSALLPSEFLAPEDRVKYLRNLGALALKRDDYATATKRFEEVVALQPNNAEAIVGLAELYQQQKQGAKAVATLAQAIAASKAAGQTPPELWYRRQLAIAYDQKLTAQVTPAAVALVQAYPSASNWRDALRIYRESGTFDTQAELDILRLMHAAGALNGERDYAEYAETAAGRGLPGEAQTVLNDGIAKNMLTTTKPYVKELKALVDGKVKGDRAGLAKFEAEARKAAAGKDALTTADAYYGYGEYAKAAELYQLAVTKGGVDANTANLRAGMAMARAGNKAGAKPLFESVKGAPREAVAQYWLLWIGQTA